MLLDFVLFFFPPKCDKVLTIWGEINPYPSVPSLIPSEAEEMCGHCLYYFYWTTGHRPAWFSDGQKIGTSEEALSRLFFPLCWATKNFRALLCKMSHRRRRMERSTTKYFNLFNVGNVL